MIKKNILLACILATGLTLAQDFKVKKGQLLVDDTPAAQISDKKGIYTLTTLSGAPLFSGKMVRATDIGGKEGYWLEFTNDKGIVHEIKDQKDGMSFSTEKILMENVVKYLGLITKNGPDQAKIDSFFASDDKSFSAPILEKIAEAKKVNDGMDAVASQDNLKVDDKGIITINGQKAGLVKTISTSTNPMMPSSETQILDLNNIIIAKVNGGSIKTYDYKSFDIIPNPGESSAVRAVKALYANGYKFGDMKATAEQTLKDREKGLVNEAKSNSLNIYDTPGYVIDKAGNKTEGPVTVEFESIDQKRGVGKNISDLTNYGGSVAVETDGKKKFFKAKDGVKFCAGERCFLGTNGSEDGGVNSGSGSQLSVLGTESQFFEIRFEKDGNYVLSHVKSPESFYLKLKNQDKAVYLGDKAAFGTKSADKIKKIFDKYVNCPALDFSKYDTKTKDGLTIVVNDYVASCAK